MAASQSTCPVCGYPDLSDAPYDKHGCASFDICPCCGTEFGYDDADGAAHKGKSPTLAELRSRWVRGGMRWWSTSTPAPCGWNPTAQLANAFESSMKHAAMHQLVIEFPCESMMDWDDIVALEDSLRAKTITGEVVDGRDSGQGIMNLFIHTPMPAETWDRFKPMVLRTRFAPSIRAASRPLTGEAYTCHHPPDMTLFSLR